MQSLPLSAQKMRIILSFPYASAPLAAGNLDAFQSVLPTLWRDLLHYGHRSTDYAHVKLDPEWAITADDLHVLQNMDRKQLRAVQRFLKMPLDST